MKRFLGRITNLLATLLLGVVAVPLQPARTAAAAPDVVDVWYGNSQVFGDKGKPQKWVNILGTADPTVTSLSYRLNEGSSRQLSLGPDNRRLAHAGDFNADIATNDLISGTNTVSITAIDSVAGPVTEDVTVQYVGNRTWSLPYNTDWASASKISDRAQVVDGAWSLTPAGIRSTVPDYDRTVAIGDVTWRDFEVTVPITIHNVDFAGAGSSQSGTPGLGLIMRWAGHTDNPVSGLQPKSGWEPNGVLGWWRWTNQTNANLQFYGLGNKPFTPVVGTTYIMKQRAETQADGSTKYSMKAWASGQAEPTAWSLVKQVAASDMSNGSILLVAHHIDATFGNVNITPLGSSSPILAANAGSDFSTIVNQPATLTGSVSYNGQDSVTTQWSKISGPGIVAFSNAANPATQVQANTPGTYVLRLTATAGSLTSTDDVTITVNSSSSSPSYRDTFNTTSLSAGWSFINPLNDANYSLSANPGHLQLNVPAGTAHDCWKTTSQCVRMMRPALGDGTYEIKVDSSPLSSKYQSYGVLLAQDDTSYLRFEFHYNGATYLKAYKVTTAGSAEVVAGPPITMAASNSMRVTKAGTTYSVAYKLGDGTWAQAGTFALAGLQLNQVGVHVINSSANAATTANIDHFSYTP